jgi:hypothetical protein
MKSDLNLISDGILDSKNHRGLYPMGSGYDVWTCDPAVGILYVTQNNPTFISGHARMRAGTNGRYPFQYQEMLNNLFGYDKDTIEVCSYLMKGRASGGDCYTVDINPDYNPDETADGQDLSGLRANSFTRWRCDPPYNAATAKSMYNCDVPNFNNLLKEGMRVVKPGSLLFLLLGPTNFQIHPKGLKRIGIILITLVPNNEIRCLNIYRKETS